MYGTLEEAITNASAGTTISLLSDVTSAGVPVVEGRDFTLDLNNNKLLLVEPYAGSSGTKTNGMQLLKDSAIALKNGTIKADDAKILIQNYSNLTLDNVKVLGSEKNLYALSNNYGNIVLKNHTKIVAQGDNVSFDLYYGMSPVYDGGVKVTIEDNTVSVVGRIEYGKADRASQADFEANTKLTTPVGFELDIPAGYTWRDNGDGTQTLIAESVDA